MSLDQFPSEIRQLIVDEPAQPPMSVPGDGGHDWSDVHRLLTVEEDRDQEFRRRVASSLNEWRDAYPGTVMPAHIRSELIEDTRYWMHRQLAEWRQALDAHWHDH